jgi:hypothetical protein
VHEDKVSTMLDGADSKALAVGAEEMEHVIIWHVPLWNGSFASGQVGSFGFVSSKSGYDEDGRTREMR